MFALRPDALSAGKCGFWVRMRTAGWSPLEWPWVSRSSTARRRSCCRRSSSPRPRWTTIEMLQAIVAWSVRNRVVVVGLAVLLLAGGLYATHQARLDVFPEFAPAQVIIQTEAPGLSAADVEQL